MKKNFCKMKPVLILLVNNQKNKCLLRKVPDGL